MPMKQPIKSVRRLDKDDLLFLLKQSNFQILLELNKTEFGFFHYLKYRKYKEPNDKEMVEVIVKLLSNVCCLKRSTIAAHMNRFFRLLKDSLQFLYDDIPIIINSCFIKNTGINLVSFMSQYMTILAAVMQKDFFPCIRIVEEIFPALENYMNRLREKRFKNIEPVESSFQCLRRAVESYETLELSDEDEFEVSGFRRTSIVPKENEILNYEVLPVPQNIIDRPYKNVEHYLSVHYRLMREDMLRSFRECIKTCQLPNNAGGNSNLHFQNVSVASIPEYSIDGILYDIVVKSSKEVDLSKKGVCLPGSLIFLSRNSFQSVIFATIKQNPASSKGLTKEFKLKIKLEDDCFNTLLDQDATYEIIQAPAYFESYKHVLTAIKEFDERNFPLSDIITYFEFDNSVPSYLNEKQFCLHEGCGSRSNHEPSHHCKVFDPLKIDEWPSFHDLKLDEQQFVAFKTAITKKVAVIQGPPGTGKTYIGKKVVKALLENVRNYTLNASSQNKDKSMNVPIVICCVTNHALDQFLEGIISGGITDNVVRLGSQSQSTLLKPYTLENLIYAVQAYKFENCVGPELKKSLSLIKQFASIVLNQKIIPDYDPEYYELKSLCIEINANVLSLSMCRNKYLDDTALNDIIDSNYKEILRKTPGHLKKSLSASILEWLACSRSKDLYDRCEKYFLAFKRQDIKHPVFKNLWDLNEQKRYELFYFWRKICLESLSKLLNNRLIRYKQILSLYNFKNVHPERLEIVKSASVIGLTTTGASKMKELIKFAKPKIIVFEEAAQVLESHIIASLVPSIEHIILIGDHEQLRPLPANHELSEKYNLKISLFERLFRNGAPSATLVSQHRMKPCIAELLVPRPYAHYTSADNVYKYEEIRGVQSSVFFFDHRQPEDANSSGTSSSNRFEAKMIACLAKYFVMQSYTVKEITILVTYSAQVLQIFNCLKEMNLSGIHVTTVDNFQGEENEIILLSFVRSNPTSIGFLKESNRLCVALSRAKRGMFCFGNFELYARKNSLWKDIVEKAQANNMLGESLVLRCDKHKFLYPSKTPEEVFGFLANGCPEPCEFLLPCSHKCTLTCHFKDPDHLLYPCQQPCERMIDETRVCPRLCFERCKKAKRKQIELPCGHLGYVGNSRCLKENQKLLPCGHFITIPCYQDSLLHKCEAPASINLECGHTKTISCYELSEKVSVVCTELRPETGACGHIVNVPCCLHLDEADLIPFCDKSCGTLLNCGHVCVSFCRICYDTGIHGFCTEKCDLILSCGHECQGYCNSPCPPCKLKCFYECEHDTKCINKCLRPCVKCEKPCSRACSHAKCSKKCHEKCNVEPCAEPCLDELDCGHQCIGLCGDPCPYLCRICNVDLMKSENPEVECGDVIEVNQLNEHRANCSLHVELECGDVIEVNELDEHVANCLLLFEWPSCPCCSQVIRKTVRYKEALMDAKELCIKSYDTSEIISEILYLVESMYGEDFIVPAQFLPIHSKIMHIIKKETPKSDSLMVLKNCIMLLKKLVSLAPKLEKTDEEKYQSKFDTLLLWIFQHLTNASFQQLNELEMAVKELIIDVTQGSI